MNRPSGNTFYLVDNTITDTVSSLKWGPNSSLLAASSWDGKIRVWDVKETYAGSGVVASAPMLATDMIDPVLQISWNREGTMIFAGCCDNTIKVWDLQQNRVMNLGQHTQPVAQVHWCEVMNVLYTMSWDRTIAIWDGKQPNPVMNTTLERKVSFLFTFTLPMITIQISHIICRSHFQ